VTVRALTTDELILETLDANNAQYSIDFLLNSHMLLQRSSSLLLPSSHSSFTINPSPHIRVHPLLSQIHPSSTTQSFEQPSPETSFESSHSFSLMTIPSPHEGEQFEG